MLDALLSRVFGRALGATGSRLGALPLALIAFSVGLAAVALIALHLYWVGLAAFLTSRIVWSLATHGRGTFAAAPVLEAVNFAGIPFGFALADPAVALAAVLMMFALSAQATGKLKFGAGWVASAELSVAFAIACIFPGRFGLVAYIASVLCFVSAGVQVGASGRSA